MRKHKRLFHACSPIGLMPDPSERTGGCDCCGYRGMRASTYCTARSVVLQSWMSAPLP